MTHQNEIINDKLNDTWVLWSHELLDNNWSIASYSNIYEFDTISNFWRLYNNFNIFGGIHNKNYFIMRKGITPIWEDEMNCNGCTCSIKLPMSKSFEFWLELSILLVGETLFDDEEKMKNINGLSIGQRNTWSIIKIWNKNINNNSASYTLKLKNRYNKYNIKIKKNNAEY